MRNKTSFFISLLVISFLFIFGCDNITDPDPVPDPTDQINYELVWEDNFDQGSLNNTYWDYDLGYGSDGWGNDEWQNYTNSNDNIKVENGNMVISAQCPSGNPGKRDGSVTSARVKTQNNISFKYGKIQARIKAPTGTGMWPAFWMLGDSFETEGWPYCGEIDIMEISPLLHGENTTLSTLHWWDEDIDGYNSYGTNYQLDEPLSDDYHVYEVEWDEIRIIGKIDDIPFFTKTIDSSTMDEFLQNFFLIFNVAVGGNLGGAPDNTTVWPQQMLIDWVRVYQNEEDLIPVETFGIFTDETPVDDGLTVGLDAEIYVWEETLTGVSYTPYEGDNVISFLSSGVGWFGAGIASNLPLDLSSFATGNMKFMIKIPANVTFKIGINDTQGNENYVTFPANETVYGLERDGEWGQVTIPISEIKGNVNLQTLSYEFIILEENGAQCHFVIDDIYWDGGGSSISSVNFDAQTYNENDSNAMITVLDEGASDSVVSVTVGNGTETINIDVTLDSSGNGTATVNFGPTNDDTDTIEITEGDLLTVSYTDSNDVSRTDSANIIGDPVSSNAFGIYTDLTPVYDALVIGENADIWVWENTLISGSIAPYEGENVISWQSAGIGWFGAGIQSASPMDFSDFADGSMKLMIKMPADVTFKIGINDDLGNENYVTFTANQTVFGLERNGDWGQAVIPFSELQGNVDLSVLSYEFIILEESGANCEFALDDIYYDDEGVATESSVSFDAESYDVIETDANISVVDEAAVNTTVSIAVDNGNDTINIDVNLDGDGNGLVVVNFGPTNDETDTIAIADGITLTASYNDADGILRTDTAIIEDNQGSEYLFGVYSDNTPVDEGITIGEDANIWVWENTLNAGSIPPYEGENVISWQSAGAGWFGAGIQSNDPLDMSAYSDGSIKLMIKMPADVTFKIGINDTNNNENYVQFPANTTVFGLERNGDWGQAIIPISDIQGNVNLQSISYVLTILEENGAVCEFALDDIYWEQ